MAKYTMTLAEYLAKGGALPSSFALIDGFENHFIGRYCDKEIGFETDALFSIKLEAKANLVMQAYKDRIDARALYWAKVPNPTKVHYELATTNTNLGAQQRSGTNTTTIGAQENKTTELPFDATEAEPNVIVNQGARSDGVITSETIGAQENSDTREARHEDNGETLDEVMRMLDFLNKDVTTLIEKLLNEFKPLFMGVY